MIFIKRKIRIKIDPSKIVRNVSCQMCAIRKGDVVKSLDPNLNLVRMGSQDDVSLVLSQASDE